MPYGALTPSGGPFQWPSGRRAFPASGLLPAPRIRPTPHRHRQQAVPPTGFGLLPVRSPLLGESSLFLGVLRCFSSPGSLSRGLHHESHPPSAGGVAPFGDPRISGCQHLPGAFRRVAASFLGRQRQGIHHALIFATAPQVSSWSKPDDPALQTQHRITRLGPDPTRPSPSSHVPHAPPLRRVGPHRASCTVRLPHSVAHGHLSKFQSSAAGAPWGAVTRTR